MNKHDLNSDLCQSNQTIYTWKLSKRIFLLSSAALLCPNVSFSWLEQRDNDAYCKGVAGRLVKIAFENDKRVKKNSWIEELMDRMIMWSSMYQMPTETGDYWHVKVFSFFLAGLAVSGREKAGGRSKRKFPWLLFFTFILIFFLRISQGNRLLNRLTFCSETEIFFTGPLWRCNGRIHTRDGKLVPC